MPVIDGTFVANVPLVAAEQVVAWTRINQHVLEQRIAVERATAPIARRVGFLIGSGIIPAVQVRELEAKLGAALVATYRFGYGEAQRELADLRARRPAPAPVSAAQREDVRPDIARHKFQRLAAEGAAEVQREAAKVAGDGPVAASGAAVKRLHLVVLENVGRALNYGRTAGALDAPGGPPTFAMRSEQLDRATCDACETLHGTITQVDSAEFYGNMPPEGCLGAGRCRGIMVYGDEEQQFAAPKG